MREDITVVIDGDAYTGKTALLFRLVNSDFIENIEIKYEPREFLKDFDFDRKYSVKYIDLLGARRYDHLRENYYAQADCLAIVLDLTEKLEIERLKKKIFLAEEVGIAPYHIIIIGNKIDLKNEILIRYDDLTIFLRDFNLKYYLETSAKEDINIIEVFELTALLGLYHKDKIQESEFKMYLENIKSRIQEIEIDTLDIIEADIQIEDLLPRDSNKEIKICPYCDNVIRLSAYYCPKCGKSQDNDKKKELNCSFHH